MDEEKSTVMKVRFIERMYPTRMGRKNLRQKDLQIRKDVCTFKVLIPNARLF